MRIPTRFLALADLDTTIDDQARCHLPIPPIGVVAHPVAGGGARVNTPVIYPHADASGDSQVKRESVVNAPQQPQFPRKQIPLPPGYLPGVV